MTSLPSNHGKKPGSATRQAVAARKTYSVAVYLVVAIVVLQVVMLISVFWLRAMVVTVNTNLPKGVGPVKPAPNYTDQTRSSRPGGAGPDFPSVPSIAATPHVGLLKVPAASDELAQVDTLNEEAQVFLKQNEYQSALDLLIKAEDIDPRIPPR